MKLRFRLGKFLLSVTAVFWASCSDDAQPLYGTIGIDDSVPESSETLESSSSVAVSSESTELSSSVTPESSSSAPDEKSSSSSVQYRLASDTSVTCKAEQFIYNECVYTASPIKDCSSLKNKLNSNKTLSTEEIAEIEDDLEECFGEAPLYGVPSCMNQMRVRTDYKCSNGTTYSYAKDGLVYTTQEFIDLFASSSSAESSSSAAPSPLCQKTDFVLRDIVADSCIAQKLDSLVAAGEDVSDNLKNCVNSSYRRAYNGEYAQTQICDGETTVNPRYQAKLDSIRKEVDKTINLCKAPDVPADSAKTPADSTVTPIDTAATSPE
ncbi:MAG: hypothetical protein IK012_04660 [Fibrobacter sp.]|uniref:hypothetical protein n=1 Tax=Fibrobacter sp. TaxID=35828 RepID=UPI0025BE30B8|nr:hypothetical protein [Fibrobacter sp.]MBR4784530.1 hypothetical protein [Fibrobacter sp.]